MTRKATDTVKSDIAANIEDNITGNIAPADIRTELYDMIDSLRPTEAAIYGMTAPVVLALTPTPVQFTDFAFIATQDVTELNPRLATDDIQALVSGFAYDISADVTFEAANNVELDIQVAVNGVLAGTIGSDIGAGVGRKKTIPISWVEFTTTTPIFTLFLSSPGAGGSITISGAFLRVTLLPDKT